MPVFAYTGSSASRGRIRGTVAADTPRQARDRLRGDGVTIERIAEQSRRGSASRAGLSPLARLRTAAARKHWATAVHDLSMLLNASTPMLEALDTLAAQHSGLFRDALLEVRDRVASGSSLTESLAQRPDIFDEASVHLVEVGESAGTLEDVLSQLAEFKRKTMQVKNQVATALLYPAFLVVFGTAAGLFLMTAVLPPLLENLGEIGREVPWPTRVVKAASDLLLGYGWLLAAMLAAVVVGAVAFLRTPRGRRVWDRLLLRLPLVGPIALRQAVSRVAMIVATMSRSGVVLTRAIELAAKSTDNVVVADALNTAGSQIAAGEDVAEALARAEVFPPLAVRVFAVGQESGRLEEMLARLAEDYERQNELLAARLTALLEPALILLLAVFVGFLLLATILPILEAGSALQ